MLGFPILYCKGKRPMMFQLSGFCYMLHQASKQVILQECVYGGRRFLEVLGRKTTLNPIM